MPVAFSANTDIVKVSSVVRGITATQDNLSSSVWLWVSRPKKKKSQNSHFILAYFCAPGLTSFVIKSLWRRAILLLSQDFWSNQYFQQKYSSLEQKSIANEIEFIEITCDSQFKR